MWRKLVLCMIAVSFILMFPARDALAGLEAVYVQKVIDLDNQAIIVRRNGQMYLIEYGVGVLSLPFYEGKTVYIYSPGLFAGIGSKIIIPDRDQEARIWQSERIDTSPLIIPHGIPTVPAPSPIAPPPQQPPPPVPRSDEIGVDSKGTKVKVFVNGSEVKSDVPAVLRNGRVLVPVRSISEALGAVVGWDASTQIVTVARTSPHDRSVGLAAALTIGKLSAGKAYSVNGEMQPPTFITLDTAPIIVNGRTLVPLRFVAEALGASVKWDEKTRSAHITR